MGNSFQTQRTFNSSFAWGSIVRWCQWCLPPSVSLTMICRQLQGLLWMLLTVLTCSPCCTLFHVHSLYAKVQQWICDSKHMFCCFLPVNLVYTHPSGGNIYRYMPHAFNTYTPFPILPYVWAKGELPWLRERQLYINPDWQNQNHYKGVLIST